MNRRIRRQPLAAPKRTSTGNRVAPGHEGNTCETIRDPAQRYRDGQVRTRLRDRIAEGLASGQGPQRTTADQAQLLAIARGEIE